MGFRVLRGYGGTGGGRGRICVSHKSGFLVTVIFLPSLVIGSLELGVGGGSVQLEHLFLMYGFLVFLWEVIAVNIFFWGCLFSLSFSLVGML